MLKDKTVVIGVTGSIAAYKAANIVSALKKLDADVYVVMTKNAENIIGPVAFETLTGHRCVSDTFDRNHEFSVGHVGLAQIADVFCVAPASANFIGKLANGIADDMLTTTAMAMTCPVIVSPAMNSRMYNSPALQDNLDRLKLHGVTVIPPDGGHLACGENGLGKLPDEQVIIDYILRAAAKEKDFAGRKVMVTAGPTIEAIDPVRFISNHSTGRMGYAIAKMAMLRGADVTLISGPVSISVPPFVKLVSVTSAQDMFEAVTDSAHEYDFIIKAAAVADYAPAEAADEKIKKSDNEMTLTLERTRDILKWLGLNKTDSQVICGFSMESRDVVENSRVKLLAKNADLIAANSLREEGAGFGSSTNHLMLIDSEGVQDLPMMSKEEAADALLDRLLGIYNERNGE